MGSKEMLDAWDKALDEYMKDNEITIDTDNCNDKKQHHGQ